MCKRNVIWLLHDFPQTLRYLGAKYGSQLAGGVNGLTPVLYSQPGDHANFLV